MRCPLPSPQVSAPRLNVEMRLPMRDGYAIVSMEMLYNWPELTRQMVHSGLFERVANFWWRAKRPGEVIARVRMMNDRIEVDDKGGTWLWLTTHQA